MAHLVNKKLFMVATTKMTRIAFSNFFTHARHVCCHKAFGLGERVLGRRQVLR